MKFLALLALVNCADARDLFTPYAPAPEEVRALLERPQPVAHFDAAIVLGCPADADGKPSLCQRCRIDGALRVHQKHLADRFLFSGGSAHSPLVEAEVMGNAAIAAGMPRDKVMMEGRALTTWQNLRYSAHLLRDAKSVLIISTADHLPRARRIALHYGFADASTGYLACDALPRALTE